MEVLVVGTAGAAGWPEPACGCHSCRGQRSSGISRGATAALVDGTLLLGAPPDLIRAPVDLTNVTHVLLRQPGPRCALPAGVVLIAPPAVATATPGAVPLESGGLTDVPGLRLEHLDDEAVPTYSLSAGDGSPLLWTSDDATGRPATRYDVVLLECGSDAGAAARRIAALREVGAITSDTDVVLVGLSHAFPPGDELSRRAAAWGARVVPDGTALHVGTATADRPRARRSHRVLVLGGARSGKSVEAERRLLAEPSVTYIATGGRREGDREWAARVAEHRRRRPAGWTTVETLDVAGALRAADAPVLVDCLALWLTGVLDREDAWERGRTPGVGAAVAELADAWAAAAVPVVAVSNEVGSGVVPATPAGRMFRDELGRLNALLAGRSDEVLLTVAGRVLRL